VSGTLTTITPNFFAPDVTSMDGSVLQDEYALVSGLVSYSDRDGNAAVQYRLIDRTNHPNSGYFTIDGVAKAQNQWFFVAPVDLDKVRYVSGVYGPQAERISFAAYDGKYWSTPTSFTMTTTPNLFRPEVTAFDAKGRVGSQSAVSHFFDWSDADGNTLKFVSFRDTGVAPQSGRFYVNGVAQTQNEWFTVPYQELDTVEYRFGNFPETELYLVQVSDGSKVSVIKSGEISAIPFPKIDIPTPDVLLDTLEKNNVKDLVVQADGGPLYTRYQIIDATVGNKSAKLTLDGTALAEDVVYTLNRDEFNRLLVEGGTADAGRGYDEVKIRAFNGLYWTSWSEMNVLTEPAYATGLLSGQKWNNVVGGKTEVTYTFIDGQNPGSPYPPLPFYYAPDDDEATGTIALSTEQRDAIRGILKTIESYANLRFVEVPYELTASQAVITFGANDQSSQGSQGWAYLPNGTGLGSKPGDVWFHNDPGNPDNVTNVDSPSRVELGNYAILTYIHEIGHALGFEHSFGHNFSLPISVDMHENTVMSYSNSSTRPFDYPISFMFYDVLGIQQVYGVNSQYETGNNYYKFNLDNTFRQSLWDSGGVDTLNYFNQLQDATIDIRQGKWSSLNGTPDALIIAYGTEIENVRATRGNDTIHGNGSRNLIWGYDGDDRITGDGGNDLLRGGAGHDVYIWETGDGIDTIREEQGGGRDAIRIQDLTGELDALENDFVFSQVGNGLRDLRIDITMNRGQSHGSIIITDQKWGMSQVETLRLYDGNNNQIGNDIDLTSIYANATNLKQRFTLTEFQTANGFIAVPV
jgi:hypothetical protein